MKSCHALHGVVCLLTSLAAVALGVSALFSYDVWGWSFFTNTPYVLKTIQVAIGVAGVLGLVGLAMSGSCTCNNPSCHG